MGRLKTDKVFIFLLAIILLFGFFIFASASLGILVKNQDLFLGIVAKQFLLGLAGGFLALFLFSKLPYRIWKKYALPIFVFSLIVTALVFVPGIGFEHGGAKRWINLASYSFQPSELLKFGLVLYLAAFFSSLKDKNDWVRFILPVIFIFILSAIMLKQPDVGTLIVMCLSAASIYFVSGAKWKNIVVIGVTIVIGLTFLVTVKPYLKDRIDTFIHPDRDPNGSSYQIKQSLIAIGSGELFGRGLGQSVQKFNFLPEPVGDSIFAVIGEELGFIGGVFIVILFLLFCLRGFKIANRSSDLFGKYLTVGIIMLIITQSFLNISSLIGVFPLTGVPLVFISHGGTALLFALMEVGIVVNISSYGNNT